MGDNLLSVDHYHQLHKDGRNRLLFDVFKLPSFSVENHCTREVYFQTWMFQDFMTSSIETSRFGVLHWEGLYAESGAEFFLWTYPSIFDMP